MKKYKVIIKHKTCRGCGNCVVVSPKFFTLDTETGLVKIRGFNKNGDELHGEIDESQLQQFEQATQACPELIIKIIK